MRRGLIYVSYDRYEYINYFYLIIDDEFILKSVPIDEIDRIFCMLEQMNIEDSDITWCIISDKDATEWEYENAFSERGKKIKFSDRVDFSYITTLLKNEFGMNFAFDNDADADRYLYMYFPEQSKGDQLRINKEDIIEKTKEILENADNDKEITEFAKIILEKYERMCRHEEF